MRSSSVRTSPTGGSEFETVAARLVAMFELRACWYEPFPYDAQLPRLEPGRVVLPAKEPGVEPWVLGAGIELPVRLGDLTLGRFVLLPAGDTCGVSLAPAGRARALRMAERAAPAIADALRASPDPAC